MKPPQSHAWAIDETMVNFGFLRRIVNFQPQVLKSCDKNRNSYSQIQQLPITVLVPIIALTFTRAVRCVFYSVMIWFLLSSPSLSFSLSPSRVSFLPYVPTLVPWQKIGVSSGVMVFLRSRTIKLASYSTRVASAPARNGSSATCSSLPALHVQSLSCRWTNSFCSSYLQPC